MSWAPSDRHGGAGATPAATLHRPHRLRELLGDTAVPCHGTGIESQVVSRELKSLAELLQC